MSINPDYSHNPEQPLRPEQARALLTILAELEPAQLDALDAYKVAPTLEEIADRRWFICIGGHAWGRALSADAARAEWKRCGGRGRCRILRMAAGAYAPAVDDFGGIHWRGSKEQPEQVHPQPRATKAKG